MRAERQAVDIVCMAPGQVISGMHEGEPSAMVPTSEDWVKHAILSLAPPRHAHLPFLPLSLPIPRLLPAALEDAVLGAPRLPALIHPWPAQHYAQAVANWLPAAFSDWIAIQTAFGLRDKYRKKMGIDPDRAEGVAQSDP